MINYLIGTGGWSYLKVPGKSSLKAYSEIFNFVEVNYTFYKYPETQTAEKWRRTVPKDFEFATRCHQDLTHKIGLRPVDEAYYVLGKMKALCGLLGSRFLVLETPSSYLFDTEAAAAARDFLSSANLRNLKLVLEARTAMTSALANLMADYDIIHSVDISHEKPATASDVVYTRLFGKGKHNIYQFTDEELKEIDEKALRTGARTIVMSYHGLRMNTDAIRFKEYKNTGTFLPVTSSVGIESAKAVLSEDAHFPTSKEALIKHQGWKVFDLTKEKRAHLSELLSEIPEGTYRNLQQLVQALEAATNQPSAG